MVGAPTEDLPGCRCLSRTMAASLLKRWCAELPAAATAGAWERVFASGANWRDFLAFTWNIRTASGEDVFRTAADTWDKVSNTNKVMALSCANQGASPNSWALEGEPQVDRATGVETYAGWLRFNTKAGTARAHIRLDKEGRAHTLMTALDELHNGQSSIGASRPRGTQHGAVKGRRYPSDPLDEEDLNPYVAIIGGGQAGMALGARLAILELETVGGNAIHPFVCMIRRGSPQNMFFIATANVGWMLHMGYGESPDSAVIGKRWKANVVDLRAAGMCLDQSNVMECVHPEAEPAWNCVACESCRLFE
eukprot:6212244-Pleurochrysis_carterae.AAC.9